jgi:cation/acetate symporter
LPEFVGDIVQAFYAHMRENPKYQELVAKRGRLSWSLFAIVMVLFYGLILVVAFKPAVIGQRVAEGSTLTVGVAAGLTLFIFFWLLTAYYVRRANGEFDRLTAEIAAEAKKELGA